MKQITAIMFLSVVLVNLGGYQLITSYRQSCASVAIEKKLDNRQYDDAELVTIKTPLNLPYYPSSVIFERVNGTITISGTTYKYVKRRVINDTLEVLCIKDYQSTCIKNAATNYFKFSNGLEQNKRSASSNTRLLFFEYCNALNILQVDAPDFYSTLHPLFSLPFNPSYLTSPIELPPEA